jgi:hypothetical protein
MAIFNLRQAKFKPKPSIDSEWDTFRKGLNLLLRPTELDNEEMAQADNIILVGKGTPTGRWGTVKYFLAGATGTVRGMGTYKNNDGTTNELLALVDEGYLEKKNGTSSTTITGQSWPSGSTIHTEQLGGKTYIVSEDVSFTEYDGTDLTVYATISSPTGFYATNYSGVTGTNRVGYRVNAVDTNGGQTLATTSYVVVDAPSLLSDTEYHLFWTAPSAATLAGYEIYRGRQGDETYLASVAGGVTNYVDRGEPESQTIYPPLANTTGGIKSNFIVKYKDRLVVVPEDDPNFVRISGKYPDHTKFAAIYGGGGVYVDPDSGDNITGIAVQPIADRLVVYKERASYLVDVQTLNVGNFVVLDPQYMPISTAVGCSSQDTIATVENDTFYFGRDGIYVTGYEPNFLNIIRTNEVSARMRPYLDMLNDDDYSTATACYIDNKYILSFPLRKELLVYDRERGSFVSKWSTPFGISKIMRYIDSSGSEKWVIGSYDSNQVYTFDASSNSDDGTTIIKTIRTGKNSFEDWTSLYILKFFYVLFRAIVGSTTVNILVEDRAGATSTVKSFTITGAEVAGSTGWGMDTWGSVKWGQSKSTTAVVASDEITRWGSLFKQSRLFQIEVTSTAANSNFELLGIKMTASKQSSGALSSSQRV